MHDSGKASDFELRPKRAQPASIKWIMQAFNY